MKSVYLTGHHTFANRGCEAIVRSTMEMLRERLGALQILVPSSDMARDSAQWPEAQACGVRFVPHYFPWHTRYWAQLQRLPLPSLKRAGWPFPLPNELRETIRSVDAVISVGGDNYSLDYRLPSLLMGEDGYAMKLGKPVILWGASVGPFDGEPDFLPAISRHLACMSLIAVRESASEAYAKHRLALNNVILMSDPAFTLEPESCDMNGFWPEDQGEGVLGLNVSPLIERYRHGSKDLCAEIVEFIRHVIHDHRLSVLLIPHVVPHDHRNNNNDAAYMRSIQDQLPELAHRVSLMDSKLNAARTKYVIAQCRFFIGARTHATIAALSSGVPTTSIAYSIKARGINQDLFGHQRFVLETPRVSAATLGHALANMAKDESELRDVLRRRLPHIRDLAFRAADNVIQIIQ